MTQTVGDFVVSRLHAWGVRKMFGYPGDGINGVFGALQRADGKIEFIQARHEEMAAFMASAYAKFSGELGVCIATSGPGATHLVTGMYDARSDHQPLLAIVGQQARRALGGYCHRISRLSRSRTWRQRWRRAIRTRPGVIRGTVRQVLSAVLPGKRE
jgi:pyruvate dehydrogenase (quinone)